MITLDDKYRLEDFGFRAYLDHEHEATPEIRRKTITIPGRPGSWNFGSDIGERHFNIPIKVTDHEQINLQYKQSAFIAFLFNEYGRPRPFKMTFDYDPGNHYYVELAGSISPNNAVYHFRNFGLSLVAGDPYKYSNAATHEIHWDSTKATFDDMWSIDTVFVDDVVITAPQTLDAYVNGLALIPDILISGSGNNVTFRTNGKSFSLKNFTNATFEIRGKDFVVLKNGVDTFTELTGDFLELLPGSNEIQITGSNMNFGLSIRVKDKYN